MKILNELIFPLFIRVSFVLFPVKKVDGDRIVINSATVSTEQVVMPKLGNASAPPDFSEKE